VLTDIQILEHDLPAAWNSYDVLCFTETGTADNTTIYQRYWPQHSVFALPSPTRSTAGAGIAVLIHNRLSHLVHPRWHDPEVACTWVSLDTRKLGLPKDLWLCTAYIPPQQSAQLRANPLAERFQVLLQQAAEATGMGYTMLTGDFNARAANLLDLADPAPPTVVPAERLCLDTSTNPAGQHMITMCQAANLALLTGRCHPDVPAAPTCRSISRPDHVIVSPDLYPLVTSHSVLPGTYGSDHNPILTTLKLPTRPRPPPAPATHPCPEQYRFRHEHRQAYWQGLQNPEVQAQLASIEDMFAQRQTVDQAMEIILTVAKDTGRSAGHPVRNPGKAADDHVKRNQPWFDNACAELFKRTQYAKRHFGEHAAVTCSYRQRFKQLAVRKKREYANQVAQDLATMVRRNPHALWRGLRNPALSMKQAAPPADPQECRPHFQHTFNPTAQPAPLPPDSLGSPDDSPDHLLNTPITIAETLAALRRQKNGKCPGMDGLQAEFLKYACPPATPGVPTAHLNPFLPALTTVYNHLLAQSTIPHSWADTLVCLVFKKGDPTVWKNYRPIAIVQLLGKIYATILQQRLSDWTESLGLRAPAQTGFRPGHATSHHAFVLQQLITNQRGRSRGHRRLYVCFVDFEQAYDSVPRDRLWQRLHDIGVRGKFLFAVKALYDAGVNLCIKTGGGLLDPIAATVGVKQGCPLSPLLFGLYIESLEEHIRIHCPEVGPSLSSANLSVKIPLLMYADDAALVATSAGQLQALLDCTAQWSTANGMNINLAKTEIVVFNSHSQPSIGTWTLGGQQVTVSTFFKYLGVKFCCMSMDNGMQKAAAQRGCAALASMKHRLGELQVGGNVGMSLHLFKALVQPALLYGAEVWGHTCLRHPGDPMVMRNEVENFQRVFLRTTLGLRRGTSLWVMYREAGMYPMQYVCLKVLLRFLSRVVHLPAREYVALAVQMACSAPHAVQEGSWFGRLKAVVAAVLPQGLALRDVLDVAAGQVDVDGILRHWRSHHYRAVWDILAPDPRTAVLHVTRSTYHRWFASPLPDEDAEWTHAPCIDCAHVPHKHMLSLIRFRTGNHHLLVDLQRRGPVEVPRHARVCTLCDMHEVQDAAHIMLTCPHLDTARHDCAAVFAGHSRMLPLFQDSTACPALAAFVHRRVQPINSTLHEQ